ncbi:hypothetical protein JJD41_23485 [Oxynema sp. CENA135]|uniref:hypothetical protein n=1 Tax=Oxynema sp. CENA135 TaxID=984206 RepID=UPI00190CF242|nr:hypothetical protein [Oxynema sp. CENA135]MBK4732806.1 hypothetical protein [Oxynema sp. CENA135]
MNNTISFPQNNTGQPQTLQEVFLQDFIDTVLWQGNSENQYWCCQLRYHPKNVKQTNTQIANQMNKQVNGGFPVTNMPGTLQGKLI